MTVFRFVIGLSFCLLVFLTAGLLKVSISADPTKLIASSSMRYQAYADILNRFPGEENQLQVFSQGSASVITAAHLNAYRSLIAPLYELPDVVQVVSLFSSPTLATALTRIIDSPNEAEASGLIREVSVLLSQPDNLFSRMLSDDGNVSLMTLSLAADADRDRALMAIESVLQRHQANYPDIHWSMAGTPVIERVIGVEVLGELLRVNALAMVLGILVAGWVLKDLLAVTQVIVVPLIAVIATLSAMGWLGMTLNLLSPAVLIVVFLVVFTDTLHALAGARTLQSLLMACALTSITTASAAMSLLFARSDVMQNFGASLLVGIAIGFLVWIIWLVVFHQRRHRPVDEQVNELEPPGISGLNEHMQELWPLYRSVSVRRRTVLAGVFLLLLLIPASQLKTGFSLYENVPNSHQLSQALSVAEAQFSGYLPLQFKLEARNKDASVDEFIDAVRSLQSALNSAQYSSSHLQLHWYSIADVLALTPGVDDTQRLTRLPLVIRDNFWQPIPESVLFAPQSISELLAAPEGQLAQIDAHLSGLADELGLSASVVTGMPALVVEASEDVFADAGRGVWVTLSVLALIVFISFKSIKIALLAAVPVTFSILAFAATLVWLGEPLRHVGIVMMTLVIGLSVDNALHLLMAIKHREHGSRLLAVRRCLPVLMAASLAIVTGFVALTVSQLPSLALVGFAAAVALGIGFMVTAILAYELFASHGPKSAETPITK